MTHATSHALDLDESFLHAVYNGLSEAVFVTRLDTHHIVYWNKGAETMFGYTPQEILGWTPAILFPDPTSYDHFYETAHQVLLNQKDQNAQDSWRTELEHKRRAGARFPAEVTLTVLDQPGHERCLMSVIRDISGRKQAEKTIRARIRQLSAIAELGHQALVGRDVSSLMADTTTLVGQALNADYCSIWECLPNEQVLRLQAGVGWQDEHVGQATVALHPAGEEPTPFLSTEPVLIQDCRIDPRLAGVSIFHTYQIASSLSVPILGQPQPFGVLGVHASSRGAFDQDDIPFLQDVANILAEAIERHRVEEELQRSETRLRVLIDATQEAVISIDQQGRILLFNPAAEKMFGYTSDEIQGKKVNLLMPEPYASEHDGYLKRYIDTHEPHAIGRIRSVAARRKNGEVFPVELSVSEVSVGGEIRYSAFLRDLSGKVRVIGEKSVLSDEV